MHPTDVTYSTTALKTSDCCIIFGSRFDACHGHGAYNNHRKLGHGARPRSLDAITLMVKPRNSMTDAFLQLHVDPLGTISRAIEEELG